MTRGPSIGIAGAGLIGRRHAELVAESQVCSLGAIADPSPEAEAVASRYGVPWFRDHRDMLAGRLVDGVIVASPNTLHVPIARDCLAAGIPVLIEKPIAETVQSANELNAFARAKNVPVLVGHHRRYNPLVREARRIVQQGEIGQLVAVSLLWLLMKPDDYFTVQWRKQEGAGPIFINLVHDIDSIRFICGEIDEVQAITSSDRRKFGVEDTAAIMFRFANGAVGTATISDSAAAPWSWELSSGENAIYPRQDADCYFFAGTRGAISFPGLRLYRYQTAPSWTAPLTSRHLSVDALDPLTEQLRHFCAVINGAEPMISAEDATRTLAVVEAIKKAARKPALVRTVATANAEAVN